MLVWIKVKFLWEISFHFSTTVEQLSGNPYRLSRCLCFVNAMYSCCIIGSTAYIMRQCLLSQTKAFLEHMHESAKGRLVNTLDNERFFHLRSNTFRFEYVLLSTYCRWVQCDVSPERQQEIDRLAGGKTLILESASADSLLSSSASVPICTRFPSTI